jgi:hypothetical protein
MLVGEMHAKPGRLGCLRCTVVDPGWLNESSAPIDESMVSHPPPAFAATRRFKLAAEHTTQLQLRGDTTMPSPMFMA